MKQSLLSAAISMLVVAVVAAGLAPAPASSQEQSLVVTSTADSGPGTLRDSLEQATPGTTITFDPTIFPPQNPATIGVTSPLPWLTQGQVTIDASNAGVILDGSELPHGEVIDGLAVTSSGNLIRGLQILHFTGSGLSIIGGAQDNTVGGDRTVGAGPSGQGNVISGNDDLGLSMRDPGTANNVITGNYIGTDVTGSLALGNGNHGIMIQRSAHNTIGGPTPGERNVISSNEAAGVRIEHPESTGNVVIGNYIGTDASGTVALGGNPHSGVAIDWGATQNRIGGLVARRRASGG